MQSRAGSPSCAMHTGGVTGVKKKFQAVPIIVKIILKVESRAVQREQRRGVLLAISIFSKDFPIQ